MLGGEDCGAIEQTKGAAGLKRDSFGKIMDDGGGGGDEGSPWLIYPQAGRKILHLFQTRSAIFTRAAGRGGVRMNEGGVLAGCKKFVPLTDLGGWGT